MSEPLLVTVAKKWLAFEEGCIDRDGPYVMSSIPNLMDEMRAALAEFEASNKAADGRRSRHFKQTHQCPTAGECWLKAAQAEMSPTPKAIT